MKVNWQFLKKPSVIVGAVILFFILLFMLNRGSSGSTGQTQVVNTGPDPTQVAAQMQLAGMQISAGIQGQAIQSDYAKAQDANQTQIALATIAAAANAQQLTASQNVALANIATQSHALDLTYQTALANNAAQVQALQIQAGTVIASSAINANLQAQLSADQLKAYGYNAAASAISTAKKGDRDQLTAQLIASMSGQGVSYGNVGGKGGVYVPPGTNTGTGTIVNIPTNFLSVAGGSLA